MLIRDINYYLDTAKENQGYSSDRKLDVALGYRGQSVHYLRKGQTLPSDEKMLEIAEMAGENTLTALLDLNIWRTRGAAQAAYIKMEQNLRKSAHMLLAIAFLAIAPSPVDAKTLTELSLAQHYSQYTLSHIY